MKNYKILGFIIGCHSCAACYIVNGEIIANIEEERLVRIKKHIDFENDFERYPVKSIENLIQRHGMELGQIDYFTSFLPLKTGIEIFRATYNFDISEHKYIQIDHHEAHSILSYYMSGFQDDTLVFCCDASGGENRYSSKTYVGTKGKLHFIDGINLKHRSFGHFYACLTELIGFKRLKDEGKVVGLSGHGTIWNDLYFAWQDVLQVIGTKTNEDNHMFECGEIYLDMYKKYFSLIGSKYWKSKSALENIAYTGQLLFEQRVIELIQNLHAKASHTKKIALSGGIFSNVKLNKKINELDIFNEIFVLPPMGDEGLALGCAVGVMSQLEPDFRPVRFKDVYFGNEYGEGEILAVSGEFQRLLFNIDKVVDFLIDKKILGLYQGRSETGPRALGNRSIICDCTHFDTYEKLNGKLQRNDYMPFAPAVLDEDVDKFFHVNKSKYSCEFMTILVDTKDEWRDKIPTVVHPKDKTARIQIVTEKTNPLFHAILKAYKKRSGIGILVNTSFNVHEEPIVEKPKEAFHHLKNKIIDYLVTPYGIFY